MSSISEFPYYKIAENLVTNNTMLLLKKLYVYNPEYLQILFDEIFEESDVVIGPQFMQQKVEKNSVPDGSIYQTGFELLIETKRGNSFDIEQIKRHLDTGAARPPILILLSSGEPKADEKERLIKECEAKQARYCFLTFSKLADTVSSIVREFELDIMNLVEAYQEFIDRAELVDRSEITMRIVCSGKTKDDNIKHNVYLCYASRGYRAHRYLGLYWNKAVRRIGKISNVVTVEMNAKGTLKSMYYAHDTKSVDEKTEVRIKGLIEAHERGEFYANADFTIPHNFFLVDEFFETDFRKISKYGMQYVKYFNLSEYFQKGIPERTELIASTLNQKEWE